MTIQMPSGKVIILSVEQYLCYTDEEMEDLLSGAHTIGFYPSSIWDGSQLSKNSKISSIDSRVDFTAEDEDSVHMESNFTIHSPTIDDEKDITEDVLEIPDDISEED